MISAQRGPVSTNERCRKDYTLCHATLDALRKAIDEIGGYPCVLKIPLSDSSAGVCIVHEDCELGAALKNTIGPAQFWGNFSPLSDLQDEMQKALAYRYESPSPSPSPVPMRTQWRIVMNPQGRYWWKSC